MQGRENRDHEVAVLKDEREVADREMDRPDQRRRLPVGEESGHAWATIWNG
jgi:hypothetical protein